MKKLCKIALPTNCIHLSHFRILLTFIDLLHNYSSCTVNCLFIRIQWMFIWNTKYRFQWQRKRHSNEMEHHWKQTNVNLMAKLLHFCVSELFVRASRIYTLLWSKSLAFQMVRYFTSRRLVSSCKRLHDIWIFEHLTFSSQFWQNIGKAHTAINAKVMYFYFQCICSSRCFFFGHFFSLFYLWLVRRTNARMAFSLSLPLSLSRKTIALFFIYWIPR